MKATSCPVVVLDDRFATVCGASNGCVVGLDHAGRVYPVAQPVSAKADDDGGREGGHAASWLPPGLVPLQTVVFGRKRVVALTTSGKVISWGGPSAASSADPSSFAATTQSTSPASFPSSSSSSSSCSISSLPSTHDVTFPASHHVTHVHRICAGAHHFGAIDDEQRLWTWGSGTFGQLGHGTRSDLAQPRLVESLGATVVDVAMGDRHTVALSSRGRVFTWGWGAGGQLGHESPVMCELEARCVRRLGSWGTVTAVYAGPLYTAVLADGQLLVWGTVDVASSHDNGLLMHSLSTPRVVATPEDIGDGNIDCDGDGDGDGNSGGNGGGNGGGSKDYTTRSDVLAVSCLETKMLVLQRTGALLYSFLSPDAAWTRLEVPRGTRPVAGALTPSEAVLLCRAVVKEEEEAEEQVQNDERVFGGVDTEQSGVEYGVEGRVVGEDGLSFDFDFDDDLDHRDSHSDDSGEGMVTAMTVAEGDEGGDREGLVLRDSTNATTLRTTDGRKGNGAPLTTRLNESKNGSQDGQDGQDGQERVEHILAGMTARMLDARRVGWMEHVTSMMENGSAVRKMHFTKSSFSKRWITLDSTRTKVGWVTPGRQNRAPRKWVALSDVVAVHYGPLSDVFQSGRSLKVRRRGRRAGGDTVCVRGKACQTIRDMPWAALVVLIVHTTHGAAAVSKHTHASHTRITHTHHTHTHKPTSSSY